MSIIAGGSKMPKSKESKGGKRGRNPHSVPLADEKPPIYII